MSSGLPMTPGAAQKAVAANYGPLLKRRIETLGMTPRQADLNWYWMWYCTTRYDGRKVAWDGGEVVDPIDAETIATAGVLPGGFFDAGVDFPLRLRKPNSPYALPRVIVNRFTSQLFSERVHPSIRCASNALLEDYVKALIDASRLWAKMQIARTFGGGQGTFCVGFKFMQGRPVVEVHDPRWVTPTFKSIEDHELKSIDKRWMWPEPVLNPDTAEYEDVWYWSRRVIDEKLDVVWNKVPVGNGEEPDWKAFQPDQAIEHGFGECPVIWGQNTPVTDADDGEPDCLGIYDMVEEMDQLLSSSGGSFKANLDPTVVIGSDLKLAELQKGSDNAIKLEKGGTAEYMEGSFTGPEKATEHAFKLRQLALEVAQCVLDADDDASPQTATEVRENTASMEARVDVMREQYGQNAVIPLIEKMLRAIRTLAQPRKNAEGQTVVNKIRLPMREVKNPDGTTSWQERKMPDIEDPTMMLSIEWPPHRKPSVQETQQAATAVKAAKDASALSNEQAIHFLQPYFGTENAAKELQLIDAEQKANEARMKENAAAAWGRP